MLESKTKKKPFTVHRYSAEQDYEKGLYSWDLALFRSPRRQEPKSLHVIEKMKTLDLAFSTVAGEYKILTFLSLMITAMEIVADKLSYGSEGRIPQRVDRIGKHKDSGAE